MKFLKYSLPIILTVFVVFACTDESLVPEPDPETAVHGYIQRNTDVENFLYQGTDELDLNFQWISIDGANTVTKIEFYVTFFEEYTDWEGGSKIANHGTQLFATYEGAAIPASREAFSFTISQADIYALFSSATYAYDVVDGDDPTVNVYGFAGKPNRNATQPFVDGDSFSLRWVMTTADGRVFDTWNDSICLEFPGANCSFNWAVVCSQDIPIPAGGGTIRIDGQDSYGDGWNGAAINVVIDGVTTAYTFTSGASDGWDIVLTGSESEIYFEFVSGDWDSEVTFQITYTDGATVIASWGPSPPEGRVVVNLCSL